MLSTQETISREQILLIVYFIAVILFFIVFGVIFFIAFQRRKNKLLLQRLKAEKQFEEELQNSKLEIQEQTLRNVSWELHDNIGQLLSTAVMQINMLNTKENTNILGAVADVRTLVSDSLREIRSLSKTLNREVIQNIGLEKAIKVELDRFERLNFLKTEFVVTGEEVPINPNDEIIVYRIIQEFFSNTIKHAEASHLAVNFAYTPERLKILVSDDGVGYDMDTVQSSSGLLNMQARASLINASIHCIAAPGNGVSLTLEYPFVDSTNSKES